MSITQSPTRLKKTMLSGNFATDTHGVAYPLAGTPSFSAAGTPCVGEAGTPNTNLVPVTLPPKIAMTHLTGTSILRPKNAQWEELVHENLDEFRRGRSTSSISRSVMKSSRSGGTVRRLARQFGKSRSTSGNTFGETSQRGKSLVKRPPTSETDHLGWRQAQARDLIIGKTIRGLPRLRIPRVQRTNVVHAITI